MSKSNKGWELGGEGRREKQQGTEMQILEGQVGGETGADERR